MRPFNKEELEILSKYEDRFRTAKELNYVRNLEPRYIAVIKKIYDDATGTESSVNTTCAHCVLTWVKKVGLKYEEDKKAYQEKAEKLVEVLDEVFGEVPDEEPKKTNKPKAKKTKK
jgi:CRISPR/Cas system CSM-associated protein Csm2 small subunit